MADEPRTIVNLDVAKSNRSTCKATGEKIEKGEPRVGVEAYAGGHITMAWQVTVLLIVLAKQFKFIGKDCRCMLWRTWDIHFTTACAQSQNGLRMLLPDR